MMEKEIFIPVIGHENLYEISSFGNLKMMEKRKGATMNILIPQWIKTNFQICKAGKGYYTIGLYRNGIRTDWFVHRLVATHFCKNEYGYKEVNHKDGNTFNNNYKNLEWCTRLQNEQHAWETGLKNMIGKNHFASIPIVQMDLYGNDIKKWESANTVYRTLGYATPHIRKCCLGRLKTAYGYKWRNDT